MSNNNAATLMTEGPIWKRVIAFAIPLFWGNLFQQLYNTADSLIVGNFLGNDALAAVSSSSHLIFLLVGFFNGLSIGAGVIVARYFGARQKELVHKSIHTTVAFGLISGLLLTLVAVPLTPVILGWMGTPPEVLPNSIAYFRIYFSGSLAFVMYNIFMGILQAVGDSRHPLMYLIFSSIVNVVLDLVLIAGLGFGVGAAALATVISQLLSALLCMIHLMRSKEEYQLILRDIRIDPQMLRQIAKNGLPAGLQNSVISIGNVVVQTNINHFGSLAVAGCGAWSKIDGFTFLPITCLALSMATFIGQNLGARQFERAKKGALFGLVCSALLAESIGVVMYIFCPFFISFFSDNPEVIAIGSSQARVMAPFCFLLALSHCMAGIFRGAGKSIVPMFVMMFIWCGIRIAYITVAVRIVPDIRVIFWAYPLTWSLSTIVFFIYFFKVDWLHSFK